MMKNVIIAFSLILLISCSCMILVDNINSEEKPKYQTNVTQGRILWSGINWEVYTDMDNCTWVDDQGQLHMRLQKVGDRWYGSELDSPTTYLYGKFIWNVSSTSLQFERNTSVGLFTYTDDLHEIDIEVNQWPGYDPRVWFVNQPGSLDYHPENIHYSIYSDSPYLNATNVTYIIDWEPTYINYAVLNSDGSVISSWNYTNASAVPNLPATLIERFDTVMNYSPVSGETKEIIFNNFRYINSSSIQRLDADFSASPLSGTAPLAVTFTDKSTGSPIYRSWNFGDGSSSNERNPTHTYTTAGTYTVSLTVSDANGTNTKCTIITVLKPVAPIANFSSNITSGFSPLSVQFYDSSRNATLWNWDFGDGSNSTVQNPAHTYFAAGNYTVRLTVSNANGTASQTSNINVKSSSSMGPSAYIPDSGNGTVSVIDIGTNTVTAKVNAGRNPWGVAVSYDGKKVYVTNVYSNSVSVIDTATNTVKATVGGISEPWGVAVSPDGKKVYVANSGSNKVSVINSATNTVAANVIVGDNPRGVAVSPDGTKVYVTNQKSNSVSIIDAATNNIITNVSAGSQPWGVAVSPDGTEVYIANYGSRTVSEIDTITNTVSNTITVGSNPVGIAFSPDGIKAYVTNYGSNTVSVIDTTTDTVLHTIVAGTNPYGVSFTPDGTRVYVSNLNSNNVSVIDAATDNIKAKVDVGRSAAFGQFIVPPLIQQPALPIANFSINSTQGYVPFSVLFLDKSKNETTRNWNFGDGFNSTQKNPTHTYSRAGSYTVNLSVSNARGSSSKSATITVFEKPVLPAANFSSNVTSGNTPLNVLFTDTSTNTPTSWDWNFGDGMANSTLKNPVRTFSRAGSYTVTLTVRNAAGNNTVRKANCIIATTLSPPVAALSANVTSGTAPKTVLFNDKSTGGSPISWAWDFGDGTSSVEKNPVHTYGKVGQYTVSLTVSNAAGNNTVIKSNYVIINVLKPPVAAFSASSASGTESFKVMFTDKSTGSPSSWTWDFGDHSAPSTIRNPVHTYTKAGKYNVSLTVSNAAGRNSMKKNNLINITKTLKVTKE